MHHEYDIRTPEKRLYKRYTANISGGSSVQLSDSKAQHELSALHSTGSIQAQFQSFHLGSTVATPAAELETNLSQFYRPHSGLFGPAAVTASETALVSDHPMPVLSELAEPVLLDFFNDPAIAFHYPASLEMRLVQEGLAHRLGHPYLNAQTREPEAVYRTLRQNALKLAQSLRVPYLTEEQLKQAQEPLLVYRLNTLEGDKVVKSPHLIVPLHFDHQKGITASSVDLSGERLTVELSIEAEKFIKARVDDLLVVASTARVEGGPDNYQEILERTKLRAPDIDLESGGNALFIGISTESQTTRLSADEQLLDIALALKSKFLTRTVTRKSYKEVTETTAHHVGSQHQATESFKATAGQHIGIESQKVETSKLELESGGTVEANPAMNFSGVEEYSYKSRDLGGKKITQCQTAHQTPQPTYWKAQNVSVKAQEKVSLNTVHCEASLTRIEAKKVELLQSMETFSQAYAEQSSNAVWQKMKTSSSETGTYHPNFFTGRLEIVSETLVIEKVAEKTLDFLQRLETDATIQERFLTEYARFKSETKQGPSAGLAILVAVVAAMVGNTQAMSWAAKVASGSLCKALGAGITALMSQFSVGLLKNDGNPLKALKELVKKENLKSLVMSMISAGVFAELSGNLDVPKATGELQSESLTQHVVELQPETLAQHFKVAALKAGINAGLEIATGTKPSEAFKMGLINTAADAISAKLANKIGTAANPNQKGGPKINPLLHKCFHGLVGGWRRRLGYEW